MKLLLKLMVSRSCFGAEDSRKEEIITLGRPPAEATVQKTPRRRSGVKSSDDWKPSLCSISEDRAVAAASRGGGDRGTVAAKPDQGQAVRKSGSSRSRSRVHVGRGSSDDYRGASSYTVAIPAFSPTPFMF